MRNDIYKSNRARAIALLYYDLVTEIEPCN